MMLIEERFFLPRHRVRGW